MGLTLASDEIRTPNEDGWYYDGQRWVCEYEVWPENWPSLRFFRRWARQLRVVAAGMGGLHYMGLEWVVLLPLIDRLGLSGEEYDDMLWCLCEIESAACDLLNSPA